MQVQIAIFFQNLLYNFTSTEDNPVHGNATNSSSLKLQSSSGGESSTASGTNAGSANGLSNQPQLQQQVSDSSGQMDFNSDDVRRMKYLFWLHLYLSICVCAWDTSFLTPLHEKLNE